METELLDKLNKLKEPKTDVIQKALELYLQNPSECNTPINRSIDAECNTERNTLPNRCNDAERNTKCNTDVNTADKVDQGKASVQIVENYELLRHYKEEIDWLRDRVEYFEGACKDLQHARSDVKAKKETASISLYRM